MNSDCWSSHNRSCTKGGRTLQLATRTVFLVLGLLVLAASGNTAHGAEARGSFVADPLSEPALSSRGIPDGSNTVDPASQYRLVVSKPLTLSRTVAATGDQVCASVTVKNVSGYPLTLDQLVVAVRLGNSWDGEHADFPAATSVWLPTGGEYSYSSCRVFWSGGAYFAEPVVRYQGSWGGITDANRLTFSISIPIALIELPRLFAQEDDQWAGPLGDGTTTIGESGCYVTSLAMAILSRFPSSGTTPLSVNEWLTTHNGFTGADMRWPASVEVEGKRGVTFTPGEGALDEQAARAREDILNAKPVLLKVGGAEGKHMIVLVGIAADGSFIFADPGEDSSLFVFPHGPAGYASPDGYIPEQFVFMDFN